MSFIPGFFFGFLLGFFAFNIGWITPAEFDVVKAKCEPYHGLRSLDDLTRDTPSQNTYEATCNDGTKLKWSVSIREQHEGSIR